MTPAARDDPGRPMTPGRAMTSAGLGLLLIRLTIGPCSTAGGSSDGTERPTTTTSPVAGTWTGSSGGTVSGGS